MKSTFTVIMLFIFASCSNQNSFVNSNEKIIIPSNSVEATDTLLHFKNGILFYRDNLFSGNIIERYENKNIHYFTSYFNGKEESLQVTYFDDKKLAEKRFYHNGEKDSTHTGWWPNGNKRFEYHFKAGVYEGNFKEWYERGEPLKFIHYTNGNDDAGKGWRQNGKLYMNFVVKNGRRYGLNNSNLCYTVKNGNGEFINSVDTSSTAIKTLKQ